MAQRKNEGKLRLTKAMLMPTALQALVHVIEKGEEKYGPATDKGWLDYQTDEILDSLLRHILALINGEAYDEIGTHHVCNIIFNAAALIEVEQNLKRIENLSEGCAWLIAPEDSFPNSPLPLKEDVCDQRASRLRDAHALPESSMP